MALVELCALCLAATLMICATIYYYLTSTHNYWKNRKVPYIKPHFPFGNFGKTLTGKTTFAQVFDDFYPVFKERGFGGVFNWRQPVLIVCKPELVKQILTKDFGSFHDRGFPYDEENDPFSANLFNLGGTRWKTLRAKLSPTFTTGKIKGMFPLIQECCDQLKDRIQGEVKGNPSVEMKDLITRFSTDVIGTCAFGIQCNSVKNPNSEFYAMSREVFKSLGSIWSILKFVLMTIAPNLSKKLKMSIVFKKMCSFFTDLMDRTIRFRRENNVERNDFVQLMMKIIDEESGDMTFDQKTMTAQAFLFFVAGLDNVANNIGLCIHAIVINPDLQERVYQEISEVLNEYQGEMCYEALHKMDLVTRILDEGLRKYPPAGVIIRSQNEDKYVIPDTDIELEKGTQVMIPIQSMHMDEEIFPNPEKFDPDRFTEEEKTKRHPYSYIPFGEGPRFCIAERFAKLEMRLCFAELVRNFKFSVVPETEIKIVFDKASLGTTPRNKFWFGVTARNTD